MGTITSLIKSSAKNSMSQLKSYDIAGKVNSALDMSGINMKMPDKVELPDALKNFKPNFGVNDLKIPPMLSGGLSPIASKLMSGVKLPSEIGGVSLPELPDLSSVTSEINGFMSSIGIDTNKLGIRSVEDILKTPEIAFDLNSVALTPTIPELPDFSSSLDGFDIGELQNQVDGITGKVPNMERIDISQYF